MKSCPWGGTNPGTSTGCKQLAGNQLCRKGLGVLKDKMNHEPVLAAKASSTWGCVRYSITCRLRVEILLCCPVLLWSAASCAGSPRPRETGMYRREPSKGALRWWRDWSVCHTRQGWRTWGHAEQVRGGILSKCINIWWEEIKTTEPDCA